MRSGANARGPVHVHAGIPLRPHDRLACVKAHAHAYRARGQLCLRLSRGSRGPASIREGDEEGVPLGVHLDATVASECLANDAALLGQRVHITLAQLLEQARRSFDVGEEEGDGAGREVAPHSIIMNQRGAELTLRHTRGSVHPCLSAVRSSTGS